MRTGAWLNDSGSIEAKGGVLDINGKVTGQGSITIDANSTVAITGASLMTSMLSFAGANATLSLAHAAAVNTDLTGFSAGDQITMAGIDKAVWSSVGQTLKLSDAGKTVDTLHLGGNYAGDVFSVAQSNGVGVITVHAGP